MFEVNPFASIGGSLLLAALVSCSDASEGLQGGGSLFVEVRDAQRQLVEGAVITSSSEDRSAATDALGSVLISNIEPGFHTITASHPTFGAARRPVHIREGDLTELTLFLPGSPSDPVEPSGQPTVTILAPESGTSFESGEVVAFDGQAINDHADRFSVTWESSIDGVLFAEMLDSGQSAAFETSELSTGNHTISMFATSPGGESGFDSIQIGIGEPVRVPGAVILDTPTSDGQSVTLSWSEPDETRAFIYRVYRADASEGDFEVVGVINDGSRTFEDSPVLFGVTYRYRVAVVLNDGTEALSNVQSIEIGQFINVATQVETMVVDPQRPYLYALDRVNNSLLFINLNDLDVEKTIFIGSSPTDLDISQTGDELYVANFGSTEIAIVNLETRERARSIFVDTQVGTWDGNPFRLTSMANDRIVFTSEDQWNDIKLVDAQSGAHLANSGSVYQPDVVSNRAGTTVYVAESGSTGSSLIRFDMSGDELTQVDESGRASGFGSRRAIVTGDDAYVFYGRSKFLARNLSSVLGTFSEAIYEASFDGTLAIGSETIFDGETFAVIRPLPISTTTMAMSSDDSTLYLYDDSSSRIYVLGLEGL